MEKPKFNCKSAGLHENDSNKMLIALANWLFHVVKNENEEKKKMILIYMLNLALYFLQNIPLSKNTKKNTGISNLNNANISIESN